MLYNSRPTRAEVNLAAIFHNVAGVKKLLSPGTRLCVVVKADAYGHGAGPAAQTALKAGADYLAVAMLEEAAQLRALGLTAPLMLLGHTPEKAAPSVAELALTQTVFSLSQGQALSQAGQASGRPVKVHLKVETGLGRLGLPPREALALACELAKLPGLELEGVFTHFAKADSDDQSYLETQFSRFLELRQALREAGLRPPLFHCANSAAILKAPQTHLDMVRLGIVAYGLWPSPELSPHPSFRPQAAMSLKTGLAFVKDVPAGSYLSYGCKFQTSRPSRIATLPIGYADGWPRGLSGRADCLIAGQRAPLVGRICMDYCLADISDLPSEPEPDSEVLLFGGPRLPVEEVAAKLDTINYEIICMLGQRVPRVYI